MNSSTAMPVKVGFVVKRTVNADPAKIMIDSEYVFLENIYSPLIEMDNNGHITPGLASHYEFIDDSVYFYIRSDAQTNRGIPITAQDASNSLKRVLILGGNTHGDLKHILCPNEEIKKLEDNCEGIRVVNNALVLTPKNNTQFLLPMLTAIDFAVIPTSTIDSNSLKIKNFFETSGPYYIESAVDNKKVILKANKRHFHYSEKMPQSIELVDVRPDDRNITLDLVRDKKVDIVTTVSHTLSKDLDEVKRLGYQIYKTDDIQLVGLKVKRLTSDEALSLSTILHYQIKDIKRPENSTITDQLFPQFSTGSLTVAQQSDLQRKMETVSKVPDRKIRISAKRPALEQYLTELLGKNLKYFEFVTDDSDYDVTYMNVDSSFLEDISLLNYHLSTGLLRPKDMSAKEWLAKFLGTKNKKERILLVKQLHYDSLVQGTVIPLFFEPYIAVSTQNWKINLSPHYANFKFWNIERK